MSGRLSGGRDPDTVRLDLADDGVATITLDSPPLNIFDLAMRDGLIEAITAVRDVPDVRAMVLRSAGDHFSAGADLSEFGSAESIFEARRIRWDRDPWGPLWELPMPTIACLQGVAVGSGLEMALLCDVRVAAPDARIGLPETKLGMLPAAGGTQSLTWAVGPGAAVPIVALAEAMDGREALRRGVVSMVADDPATKGRELARRVAGWRPGPLAAIKRSIRAAVDLPLHEGLAVERRLGRAMH